MYLFFPIAVAVLFLFFDSSDNRGNVPCPALNTILYRNADTLPLNKNKQTSTENIEVEAFFNSNEWKTYLEKEFQKVVNKAQIKGILPGKYELKICFCIAYDGKINDVTVSNDPGFGIGAGLVLLFKSAKPWQPQYKNGKPVSSSYFMQELNFIIAKNDF